MLLVVFHDEHGAELYVNPYEVCAVCHTGTDQSGATIIFSGISVQVKETPGAVKYVLGKLPAPATATHDFGLKKTLSGLS